MEARRIPRVDDLDLRILRDLAWKPGDPGHLARGIRRPWDIARSAGAHGVTVKRRVAAMREADILEGPYLFPSEHVLRIRSALYRFTFPDASTKTAGLARIPAIPEAGEFHNFVGNEAWIAVVVPDGGSIPAAAERVRAAVGAQEARLFYERRWLRDATTLTRLEWRILASLVRDAYRPVSEVAEAVGVTPKTVRARLSNLAREEAFAIIPHIRLAEVRGVFAFVLMIVCRETATPDDRAGVLNAFPEAFYRSSRSADHAYLLLAGETSKAAEDALLRALAIPVVEHARVLLVRETVTFVEKAARLAREHAIGGDEGRVPDRTPDVHQP